MEKDKKSEIHITNNFNAPIGQHIDHVGSIESTFVMSEVKQSYGLNI